MSRRPKPWYREFNDTWYIQKDGEKIPLAVGKDNEDAAYDEFHRIMGGGKKAVKSPQIKLLLDLFLEHTEKHCKPTTLDWYLYFLKKFSKAHGDLRVDQLKVHHVQRWLDKLSEGSRRGAVQALKRAFAWGIEQDYISDHPLKKLKTPPGRARERLLTEVERQAIRKSYHKGDPWLDFLTAMEESGARPGEIARVTAAHVDLESGLWRFGAGEHKTGRKTRKPRLIVLTPVLSLLSQKLMTLHPTGPLFRNRSGRPWTRNAIRCRFRRIRVKLGLGPDVCAYLYRHAFVTDALTNGVPVASVAELVGHKDTSMIAQHYSKLHEQREHLRQMAIKARGTSASGESSSPPAGGR